MTWDANAKISVSRYEAIFIQSEVFFVVVCVCFFTHTFPPLKGQYGKSPHASRCYGFQLVKL